MDSKRSAGAPIVWQCKTYDELTKDQLYETLRLRSEIFVLEQDCVYLDIDGVDRQCWHLMGWSDNKLVAYMRIIPTGIEGQEVGSIGRIVVRAEYRGTGLGHELVDRGIKLYNQLIGEEYPIIIHAQSQLERFYSLHGFEVTSAPFMFEGRLHTFMQRNPQRPSDP